MIFIYKDGVFESRIEVTNANSSNTSVVQSNNCLVVIFPYYQNPLKFLKPISYYTHLQYFFTLSLIEVLKRLCLYFTSFVDGISVRL